jgi:hypothetical protein
MTKKNIRFKLLATNILYFMLKKNTILFEQPVTKTVSSCLYIKLNIMDTPFLEPIEKPKGLLGKLVYA